MTKTDFIIECAMRLYSRKGYRAVTAINDAECLASELEKRGYLKK